MTHGTGLKHALNTAASRRHEVKFSTNTSPNSATRINSTGSRGLGGCAVAQPYNFGFFVTTMSMFF